ncbi:ester cyclase [Spirosoma sp. KNUC1025]|uniref:ester cyclase n=1 Tax=Spirosoma sp. KNUC1025 TaxID=2894082 RepID=UPI00386D9BBC|nr:ester cyclase [Spirosoma sp. KNUC1025]
MKKEEAIIQAYVGEVINRKQLNLIDQYFAEECYLRTTTGREVRGRESFRQALQGVFTAFPDLYVTIDELVAVEGQVAYRITAQGTQQTDFESIAPSQPPTSFRFSEAFFVKLEADKITDVWILMDMHSLLNQLNRPIVLAEPVLEQ